MKTWTIRHIRMLRHAIALWRTGHDAHRWEILHYWYTARFTDIPA